jgi:hypothetical protein
MSNSNIEKSLPKTIDVLGKKFTIEALKPDEYEECDGFMSLPQQVIGIRLQPAMDYNHDTMFHEITHAVDEILGLGLKEKQVHQLSAGLIAVLKQNKELTEWLLR